MDTLHGTEIFLEKKNWLQHTCKNSNIKIIIFSMVMNVSFISFLSPSLGHEERVEETKARGGEYTSGNWIIYNPGQHGVMSYKSQTQISIQ